MRSWANAASGHEIATPPRSDMACRRSIDPSYRGFSLPYRGLKGRCALQLVRSAEVGCGSTFQFCGFRSAYIAERPKAKCPSTSQRRTFQRCRPSITVFTRARRRKPGRSRRRISLSRARRCLSSASATPTAASQISGANRSLRLNSLDRTPQVPLSSIAGRHRGHAIVPKTIWIRLFQVRRPALRALRAQAY